MKHTFIFSCTDNGGVHQTFEVRATDKQEAIRKGMKTAKKFACGDICGDWECKLNLRAASRIRTHMRREVLELDESSLRARRHSTLISITRLIFT